MARVMAAINGVYLGGGGFSAQAGYDHRAVWVVGLVFAIILFLRNDSDHRRLVTDRL